MRMLLWIGFAILAAAVVRRPASVRRAASGDGERGGCRPRGLPRPARRDRRRARARALIARRESKAARAEVARRIIRAREQSKPGAGCDARPDRCTHRGAAWSPPLLPVLAHRPVSRRRVAGAARRAPTRRGATAPLEQATVVDLDRARRGAPARSTPTTARAGTCIAPVYLRLQRYGDAAYAFARGQPARWASPCAACRFCRSAAARRERHRRRAGAAGLCEAARTRAGPHEARVWLALAKEQDGDLAGAVSGVPRRLTSTATRRRGEPWRRAVVDSAVEPARATRHRPAPPDAPPDGRPASPPTDAPPRRRRRFIAAMVDRPRRSASRRDGKDLDGWLQARARL